MAKRKKKSSIKLEIESLVKEKVDPSYLERIGSIVDTESADDVSVCRAIAMAQVKKGLEGDLRAAEFIEDILSEAEREKADPNLKLVLKVVGAPGAENGA